MKLRKDLKINGKLVKKGETIPWWYIYPFFCIHMLVFAGSGFLLAYTGDGPGRALPFLYIHGGGAIVIYLIFYLAIFGRDQVMWMFVNAAIGGLATYTQIDWILSLFGKQAQDYSYAVHAIPFLYFVLYTFLLRQAVLDITGALDNKIKEGVVSWAYAVISIVFYLTF